MIRISQFVLKSKNYCYYVSKYRNRSFSKNIAKKVDEIQSCKQSITSTDIFTNVPGYFEVGIIGGGLAPIYACAVLKQYPLIKCIHLIDTKNMLDKAVFDTAFIDMTPKIKYYKIDHIGDEKTQDMLRNLDIIGIMDEDDFHLGHLKPEDQFITSCRFVKETAKYLAGCCKNALVAVFTRPVTATMPLVFECYIDAGRWEPCKIIGSVALETMRIESATAEFSGLDASCMCIPIVGGADSYSAIPLFSKAKPYTDFTQCQKDLLLQFYRYADRDSCQSCSNGPAISTGAATARFILTLVAGLRGCEHVVSNAFVRSKIMPLCNYFTSRICFGSNGIKTILDIPRTTPHEEDLLRDSISFINRCEQKVENIIEKDVQSEAECKEKCKN